MSEDKLNHRVIDTEITNQYYSEYGPTSHGHLVVRCNKANKAFKTSFTQALRGKQKKIEFSYCPLCGGKLWKEN